MLKFRQTFCDGENYTREREFWNLFQDILIFLCVSFFCNKGNYSEEFQLKYFARRLILQTESKQS
jgi:hypothetical protein